MKYFYIWVVYKMIIVLYSVSNNLEGERDIEILVFV